MFVCVWVCLEGGWGWEYRSEGSRPSLVKTSSNLWPLQIRPWPWSSNSNLLNLIMWPWPCLCDLDLGYLTFALVMWPPEGIKGRIAWNRLLWISFFEHPFCSDFDSKTYSLCFISDFVGSPWKVVKKKGYQHHRFEKISLRVRQVVFNDFLINSKL